MSELIERLDLYAVALGGAQDASPPEQDDLPEPVLRRDVQCFGVTEMPFASQEDMEALLGQIGDVIRFGGGMLDQAVKGRSRQEPPSALLCGQLGLIAKGVAAVDERPLVDARFHLEDCGAVDELESFDPQAASARIGREVRLFRDLRSQLPQYLKDCPQ